MVIELVSGVDFWCKIYVRGRPGRSKGLSLRGPGVDFRPKTPESLETPVVKNYR